MNNMQKTPLQEAVERAHALGRRAVIPFITAGFPDKDSFWVNWRRRNRWTGYYHCYQSMFPQK